ncbi:GNAT family N-acetyltransferase [Candidatus Peribacteria bacterium]|nr:GNAT family N-acetyltransferase [Candidatus Peribacteria bacterium]
MRLIYSECRPDYATMTFGYGVYALAEEENPAAWDSAFAAGYSPHTMTPWVEGKTVFRLNRSVRIALRDWTETSENRRLEGKVAPLSITAALIPLEEFAFTEAFWRFCEHYSEQRWLTGRRFDRAHLERLIATPVATHILTYTSDGQPIGYVLSCWTGVSFYHWFSFYDLRYYDDYSLGKWCMGHCIAWAAAAGGQYAYLGTCYGESARYKVRDFNAVEWYTGEGWSRDRELLREACRQDTEGMPTERIKQPAMAASLFHLSSSSS